MPALEEVRCPYCNLLLLKKEVGAALTIEIKCHRCDEKTYFDIKASNGGTTNSGMIAPSETKSV